MRVALITDGIWPYVLGGMQKHSFYLCKYMARKKVEVDLYHFNSSSYDISKLEFFSEEEKKYIHSHVIDFPKGMSFPGHYLWKSYKYSKLVYKAIKSNLADYNFLYTKGFSGWYLFNQKHSKKINCAPIGVKFHGYEMFQKSPDLKTLIQQILFLRVPVKSISQRADVVFSYGGKITEIIKSIGVKQEKIFELPSGVEESFLAENVNETKGIIRFMFLGRYERRKGVEELNAAISNLILKGNARNIEFHFIGPIPGDKKITNSKIFYHGEIRDKKVLRDKIRLCDILICPSWSEGMPNAILEAMACGLAVVATDVGATNVLVNEKTGWLLKSSSVVEIELELNSIMSETDEEITNKKKEALKLIRNNFVWEKLITKLLERF